MKKSNITCSVIVLNYFGERVIESTIRSLLNLNFPKDDLEIIIVDNASKDKSRKIINQIVSKNNKIVKKLFLKKNFGFSKGNNQGIKIAKGKYVVLLNNDCIVDKNWLIELYKTAESDKNIFSVGSKILIYPTYTFFSLPLLDSLLLNKCFLTKSNILSFTKEKELNIPFEYLGTKGNMEIPFDSKKDKKIDINLVFLNEKKLPIDKILQFYKSLNIVEYKIIKRKYISLICSIYVNKITDKYSKIQNAGSIVFQDGYGRDIGAEIKYQRQNYENDKGQYETTREVYSTCGAAVLYNKEILNKIGYLDESFFMYYEDTEISERARILGYKNMYCHKALVRHLHALSSKEWSPFFLFNVEKGRLLHLFYTFPNNIFIKEFIKYIIKSNIKLLKNVKNGQNITNSLQNVKVIIDIIFNLSKYQKIKISKGFNSDKVNENYKDVINGYWLFN